MIMTNDTYSSPAEAAFGRGRFSEAEDAAIRDGWPDLAGIASALGRPRHSVLTRGRRLGLDPLHGPSKRPFSDEERQMVMERYVADGAKPLAMELGRKTACIVSLAQRLGLRFDGLWPWTPDEDDALVRLKREGRTTAVIAAEVGRSVPAVAKRFEHLGLTVRQFDPIARRQRLITTYERLKRGPEQRWARERMALGEHGWPPDLNPKEVAILDSLRTRGPQSRRNLSLSVGEPEGRADRKRLMTHGGCSSMARLLARGLVTRCFLRDGRKALVLYVLTQSAEQQHGQFPSVIEFNAAIANRVSAGGTAATHTRSKAS